MSNRSTTTVKLLFFSSGFLASDLTLVSHLRAELNRLIDLKIFDETQYYDLINSEIKIRKNDIEIELFGEIKEPIDLVKNEEKEIKN